MAAGLVPFAVGSETWGSIMTPASFCGLTGLRPTAGLVSKAGVMELAWSMDKLGPMARSAQDCGWILQAMAGYDPADPATVRSGFVFRPWIQRRTLRLGVLPLDYGDAPGGTETQKAFMEAMRVLRAAGMKISPAPWPDYPMGEVARTVLGGETAAAHEEFIKSDRLNELIDDGQKEGLRKYRGLTAAELGRAFVQRARAARAIYRLFEQFDALIAPTLIGEATTLDTNLNTRFRGGGYRGTSVLGAVAGVPSVSLPVVPR